MRYCNENSIEFELPDGSKHDININGFNIDRKRLNPYQIKDFPYQFKSIEENRSFKNFLANNSLFDKIPWKIAKKDLKQNIKINKEKYGIPQGLVLV